MNIVSHDRADLLILALAVQGLWVPVISCMTNGEWQLTQSVYTIPSKFVYFDNLVCRILYMPWKPAFQRSKGIG
jgi:hypothetical protein